MTPWISLLISAGNSLVFVGVVFGTLSSRSKQNSIFIRELSEHMKEHIDEIKRTKASTERMDAFEDRIDRFEENLNKKMEELKDSIKELSRRGL